MKLLLKKHVGVVLIMFVVLMSVVIPDIHSQPGMIKGVRPDVQNPSDSIKADSVKVYKEALIDSVIQFGKKFLGYKYRYGGYTPEGFDCSGYMSYIFSNHGYNFPRSSSGMATVGYQVDLKDARKGDFIYFQGRSIQSSRVGHVALIIETDSVTITMMHSCRRGVLIEKLAGNDYYTRRFLMVRRYDF